VFAAAMLVPLGPQGAAASSPGSGASYRIEWSGAQCPGTPLGHVSTNQTADGKVTACLDVPDVPGGTYHLFLSQYRTGKAGPKGPANPDGAQVRRYPRLVWLKVPEPEVMSAPRLPGPGALRRQRQQGRGERRANRGFNKRPNRDEVRLDLAGLGWSGRPAQRTN
jgi:hypothetical protein